MLAYQATLRAPFCAIIIGAPATANLPGPGVAGINLSSRPRGSGKHSSGTFLRRPDVSSPKFFLPSPTPSRIAVRGCPADCWLLRSRGCPFHTVTNLDKNSSGRVRNLLTPFHSAGRSVEPVCVCSRRRGLDTVTRKQRCRLDAPIRNIWVRSVSEKSAG